MIRKSNEIGWEQEKAKREKYYYFKRLIRFDKIDTVNKCIKNNRQILQFYAIIQHVI